MKTGLIFGLLTLVGLSSVPSFVCDEETFPPHGEQTSTTKRSADEIPVSTYRVVRRYPHDHLAYTQGLIFEDGFLYESTGGSRWSTAILGQSSLRKVDLETGRVLQMRALPPDYFGEGITLFGDRIIQLTWKSRIGFVYDKKSFDVLQQFAIAHTERGGLSNQPEAWGITHDGKRLIMSDGTPILRFWDPETFAEIGRMEVVANGQPVVWLNELEYIKEEIFANVLYAERIARISPETGEVRGWVDLTGLLSAAERGPTVDVLNGIAYDSEEDRLFVTGKGWPRLFEIEIIPPN